MLNLPESCTRSRTESHYSIRPRDSFQEQLNIAAMYSHVKPLLPYSTISLPTIGPVMCLQLLLMTEA